MVIVTPSIFSPVCVFGHGSGDRMVWACKQKESKRNTGKKSNRSFFIQAVLALMLVAQYYLKRTVAGIRSTNFLSKKEFKYLDSFRADH